MASGKSEDEAMGVKRPAWCKRSLCGVLKAGISEGTVQGMNPERMAGVMKKVTEEVKEEYWRVLHVDEQGNLE